MHHNLNELFGIFGGSGSFKQWCPVVQCCSDISSVSLLADLGFDVAFFGLTINAVLQNPRQIMCWGEGAVFMRYHSFFLSTLRFERIALFVV